MRGFGVALYLGLALLTIPEAAAAQQWIVDASAGAADYEAVAGDVGSLHAILSLRRQGLTWLSLSAGAPLDSEAIPWLAAGAGSRLSRGLRTVEIGVDLAAVGFGYEVSELDATGGGATLVGLPFVGFDLGSGRVELRSGALHHTSIFDGESSSRTVYDGGVRGTIAPAARLMLEGEGRLVHDGDASYPYAGLAAEVAAGPASVWARGGRWMADELSATAWGVGARMLLPVGLLVSASYEQETDDPLYWNGPRSGWMVGVSRALGSARRSAALAVVPENFRRDAGVVVVRVPIAESAEMPSIAGDFTAWESVPMRRAEGVWEASFELAPGVYHYSFVRPDGSWFLPESVTNRVDDGFGGTNAVLVVAAP
jgi:hypothetical protein